MSKQTGVFDPKDLVKVSLPKRPVVLKSGGPIMELEKIEGGVAFCGWEEEGQLFGSPFPLQCLYQCTEVDETVNPHKDPKKMPIYCNTIDSGTQKVRMTRIDRRTGEHIFLDEGSPVVELKNDD